MAERDSEHDPEPASESERASDAASNSAPEPTPDPEQFSGRAPGSAPADAPESVHGHAPSHAGIDRRKVLGVAAAIAGVAGLGVAIAETAGSGPSSDSGSSSHSGPGTGASSGPSGPGNQGAGTHGVAEEDLPGDSRWRITSAGPAHAIEGYADKVSVLPGESVGLRVSTTAGSFTVSAYRMGWYGGAEARLVWRSGSVPGSAQSAARFAASTRTVYTSWHDSLTVPTKGWPPGAYLLRLESSAGHRSFVPLIVRSASAAGKVLLMHAPATWQAYNLWGGYNLYQGPSGSYSSRSYTVSFDRPYDSNGAEKFLIYERAVVALAERLRLPVAYTTGIDVHQDPGVLSGARAVISLGHDEYWTPQQRSSVTKARDAGTNVAFLGANTCFRRIRFGDGQSSAGPNRTVICYKTAYTKDPLYGHDGSLVTTDYRTSPAADPESSMTGVLYEDYPTDAAFVVHAADHWLYEGTGVKNGDSFAHLIGVEYDRVTPGQPTPRPIQIIGHSPLVCNGRSSHSDAAYYTVPSGAGVFASGTMRWVEGLMAGTRDDRTDHGMDRRTAAFVSRTTENLLRAFAAGPAGRLRPAPQDNVKAVYGV